MTREQAINEIKSWAIPSEKGREVLETLIPELRESEDERIRKELIDMINKCTNWAHKKEYVKYLGKKKDPEDKGEISDGYHTFNELYYYRLLYNAAFFNLLPKEWVHKSKKHHDGEDCFGGGWFIVMANLPTGQISNHYELKDWDLFQIPEKEIADEWDGHTPQEAAERLHEYLQEKRKEQRPIKMEVYEVGKGTTVCGQDYKCKKDYKMGNCWYIKDAIYHCGRDGYLTDQNGVSWSCTPEWFNEYIQSNTEWAEEEKNHFEQNNTTINGEPIPTENQSVDIPLAGWSEKDEVAMRITIDWLIAYRDRHANLQETKDEIDYCIDWLKALRSQHNKEIYQTAKHNLAIKFMNYMDENRPEGKMSLSNIECEDIDKAFRENDWVKIMRYIEKYHPSWKPSKEQMEAFEDAMTYIPEFYKPKSNLASLLRDLKKRM